LESAAQAPGMVALMRWFEATSHVLALDQPEFEPILRVRSMEGKEARIADYWCCGFMAGVPPDDRRLAASG